MRRCDHDTTWSHVDGETICDACEEVMGEDFATRMERQSIEAFEQKLRDEGSARRADQHLEGA